MTFLASDAMKGRGSGTEDEWRAATYIGSQLLRWGIEPLGDAGGFVQEVATGRSLVVAPPVLTIKDVKLTHGREMLVQALGATSFLLAATYFWFPALIIGRGVYLIATTLVILVVIGWRLAFEWFISKVAPRERILLVGTSQEILQQHNIT
jgi:hypothetical protein